MIRRLFRSLSVEGLGTSADLNDWLYSDYHGICYVCIYGYLHLYVFVDIYIYIHTYIHTYSRFQSPTLSHSKNNIYIYIYIYIYTHLQLHTHIHMYIYIYTASAFQRTKAPKPTALNHGRNDAEANLRA